MVGPSVADSVRPYRLLVIVATLVTAALAVPSPQSQSPEVVTVAQRPTAAQSGRAFAVSLRSVLGDVTVADTGDVNGRPLSAVREHVVDLRSSLVSARVADASVTAPDAESVRSEASVAGLEVNLLGEGLEGLLGLTAAPRLSISIGAVRAVSESSCAAESTSEVEIARISINGIELAIGGRPGPNARIAVGQLPLVSVVLNEQIRLPGGTGLTVNAVHIKVADVVDLVVSSARSEVASCPTEDREPPVVDIGLGGGTGAPAGTAAGAGVVTRVVRPGRVAAVRGRGFPPSAPVRLAFDGSDLPPIDATAGADGTIEAAVVVPRHARLGIRTLTATSGDLAATVRFLVVRPPAQPPGAPFEPTSG